MGRLIRAKCASCRRDVDQESTEYLITQPVLLGEYDEYERGIYMFTCIHCGYVNTKETTPKIEGLLRAGGVMTVDELKDWLVTELEAEL